MSDLVLHRRSFLTGAIALICAPAIVRASSLMPIKALPVEVWRKGTVYDAIMLRRGIWEVIYVNSSDADLTPSQWRAFTAYTYAK